MRRPRYRVVQLSDLHLLADAQLYARVDPYERIQAAFDALVAANWQVDVVVLSGDLADRGEAAAYDRLRSVIARGRELLGAQLMVVPGNHDDVGRVRSILLGLEPRDGPLDSVVRAKGLRVIGLDSSVLGVDYGELRAPERLADAIRGTDVLIVLSGHTHRASAGALAGIPVWVSPATASVTDPLFRHGFRGHSGGGFTCVDLLDHGEIVTTAIRRPCATTALGITADAG